MSKLSVPRRGSLGFLPKKRAIRPYASFEKYPKVEGTKALAFPGYKAGMTRVAAVDKDKNSPSFEQKIMLPVTIIEVPSAKVFGIKCYETTHDGLRAIVMIWADGFEKNLGRKMRLPKQPKTQAKVAEAEKMLGRISEVRIMVHTKPTFKKKPEAFEVLVGAKDAKGAFEYAKSVLGKEIAAKDLFKEGDWIDVRAITAGKGIQGPVKRWGSKIQYRKAHGKRRHVGCINPWSPRRIMWTSLMAGQHGYHKRTLLNSRVLKLGDNGAEIMPKGGLSRYGNVKSSYLLLKGSVPGTKKRMVMMRFAARAPRKSPEMPEVTKVVTASQQGSGR